ncbi:MAG: filamentous hemagglutinin N-terminal domain-containing protein [Pleurocapsa sp. MO_226.B13]|nr:filamentous hemagglutinin N-terminal domain-containing protein [Pleurocapsa sp. MO_226.B13]
MKLNLIQPFLQQQLVRVGKHLGISIILFLTIPTALVKAQVTPDGTLPTSVEGRENSININGGARAGNNLFHSFEEFSVPENIEAVFNNAGNIENIFSRITGESISTIDGILRTQGSANLFLINPNGIIFGENAQLDVGGSFLATTAERIQFEDGVEFSALREEQAPILTVSVPIGLEFGNNPGNITVRGTGGDLTLDPQTGEIVTDNRPVGLSVKPDRTLALVGGNINLEGGNLTAPAGTIELGSVGSKEIVGLVRDNSQWQLNYQGVEKFQDIQWSQASSAYASGNSGGSIQVRGRQVNLVDNSAILSATLGNGSGGEISLKASESIDLVLSSTIRNITNASGRGGDILIETKNLRLTDGAQMGNATYGKGNSGNIIVIAGNIEIKGVDPLESLLSSTIATSVLFNATGNGGDVTIEAKSLRLSNSGQIQADTLGSGDAGNIDVTVSDIEITGGSATSFGPSGFGTLTFPGSTGNGGDLTIEAERLFLGESTQLVLATFGKGNGGDLTIFAERVELEGSTSFGRSGLFTSAIIDNGNGGNINVDADLLTIRDGATISTSNFQSLNLSPPGTGSPGNIQIDAETMILDRGSITANTLEGDRGNIVLDANNIFLLNGSQITIDAESTDGGNLDLDADSLTILNGSIISANALMGEGGNIQIDTTGLFRSAEATIEASSQLGIDGTVQIDTPDLNLQRELEPRELELVTAEGAIANSCLDPQNSQGSLNLTGAGGFPKSPESNYTDVNFSLTGVPSPPAPNSELSTVNSQQQLSLIRATKMVTTESGRIFLVAAPQKAESLVCQSVSE